MVSVSPVLLRLQLSLQHKQLSSDDPRSGRSRSRATAKAKAQTTRDKSSGFGSRKDLSKEKQRGILNSYLNSAFFMCVDPWMVSVSPSPVLLRVQLSLQHIQLVLRRSERRQLPRGGNGKGNGKGSTLLTFEDEKLLVAEALVLSTKLHDILSLSGPTYPPVK